MSFEPLSVQEEATAKEIVDAAYRVHKALGPGLLEKVYETCFCHELTKRYLACERQKEVQIEYDVPMIKKGITRLIL